MFFDEDLMYAAAIYRLCPNMAESLCSTSPGPFRSGQIG